MKMTEKSELHVGTRLRIARLLHGRTQAELAKQLMVSPAFLCQVEAGTKQPGVQLLAALATALEVDPSFFTRAIGDEFRDEECFFRRRRTTAMYLRAQALAHGTFLSEFVSALEERVALPAHDVPHTSEEAGLRIDEIAEQCRTHWGLGLDTPITNMTRVLENAGVVVADFESSKKIDAFSRVGARRIVVRNTETQARSRLRFDLAHECGHLVMHVGLDASNVELEGRADAFASAFLLPRRAFVPEFPRSPSPNWDALRVMKRRWGVSLAAIVRRARDLKLVDGLYYQRAYKQLSARRWHVVEPDEAFVPAEEPEIIPRALAIIEKHLGLTAANFARELGWSSALFKVVTGQECDERPPDIISLNQFRARSR
jgi:Zn-dependent peptidase ImmA (M78 family)/transcriptional regulator with XRE-family HTH domain